VLEPWVRDALPGEAGPRAVPHAVRCPGGNVVSRRWMLDSGVWKGLAETLDIVQILSRAHGHVACLGGLLPPRVCERLLEPGI